MKSKNKNVTILISALIFVSLANKSHQDYWWQNSNNQVARQAYGNMPQPPQQAQQQPQSQTQEPQFVPTAQEQTINGIQFDCTNKPTGPNKDNKYCDVYHACVFGKQLKTYACAQLGERIYYDENTQKCEFSSKNPQSCSSGNYYSPLQMTQPSQPNPQQSSSIGGYQQPQQPQGQGQQEQQVEKVEAWKEYVRKNEQFECKDKTDGFYSSKWCNVYYRCFNKIKSEFLCAKMQSGERLWWMKHSEQMSSVQQEEAQCQWPCDIGRKCTSPGGILVVVNDNQISESTSDAQKILDSCPKPESNNNNNQQSPSYSNGQMNDQKIVEDNSNDLFRLTDFSDNVCSGASDGSFVSNGKYCNVYHVCIKGVRKDFLCAKGSSTYDLWWNDSTKQCEWPCKLQCTKQIFGSFGQTASDISNLDRKLNPALCGGDDSSSSSNNNNGLGSYGNQQQSDLTRPHPQVTQPSFNNNNNNNNNYGSGYGNSYGNYYF